MKTVKMYKNIPQKALCMFVVLCRFFSRIDKVQLLTSEWSTHRKTWGLSLFSIGMQLPFDGRSNYTTKTFAWVSYYNKSWHCGFMFLKIA